MQGCAPQVKLLESLGRKEHRWAFLVISVTRHTLLSANEVTTEILFEYLFIYGVTLFCHEKIIYGTAVTNCMI